MKIPSREDIAQLSYEDATLHTVATYYILHPELTPEEFLRMAVFALVGQLALVREDCAKLIERTDMLHGMA